MLHILIGTRALVGKPSGVSKFDFSDNFVSTRIQRRYKISRAGTAER